MLHSRRTVDELLEPKDAQRRAEFYDRTWDSWRWRMLFRLFFSRTVMGRFGRDPRFFDYVDGAIGDRLLARSRHALVDLEPAANPYLHWILTGSHGDALPLRAARRELRAHPRQPRSAGVAPLAAGDVPAASRSVPAFDGANLSDIFEYMSAENYAALLEQVAGACTPGARLVYWNMMVPRSRPEAMANRLLPLTDEAARLHYQDKAFFYRRAGGRAGARMIPPLLGIALVLGVFGTLFLGLRAARSRLDPELSRKLLHLGMGLVSLTLPWIFSTTWPVIVLSSLAGLALLSIRVSSAMKREFGSVLHAVGRESFGEFFYTIAVATLFVLSHGDKLLFSIPILTLTFADAVAALVGVRYGSVRFATPDGIKSVEGSLACFGVAFLCVHIPLLLFSTTGRLEALLIAVILGFLVMLVEAIAWRGLDNLTIPLAGFALLPELHPLERPELAMRLAVVLVLVAFSYALRRQSTLDDDALMACVLFGFVAWALGGWMWMLAPAAIMINDARHGIRVAAKHERISPPQRPHGRKRVSRRGDLGGARGDVRRSTPSAWRATTGVLLRVYVGLRHPHGDLRGEARDARATARSGASGRLSPRRW